MSDAPQSSAGRFLLPLGALLTLMGVVETFVTPDPGSYFGYAALLLGPGLLALWWGERTGNTALRTVGHVAASIGAVIALVDIVLDFV